MEGSTEGSKEEKAGKGEERTEIRKHGRMKVWVNGRKKKKRNDG